MKQVRETIAILALALLMPVWVHAASFDCAKAQTIVEESICSDEKLGMLDEMLSANYKAVMAAAKATNPGYVDTLKANQKEWMQERNQCTDINCITIAYADRVTDICERAMLNGVEVDDCTKYDARDDDGSQQQVQQMTELPLEIKWSGGDLWITSVVDNVTINKITINRGNCKTIDLAAKRAEAAAKAAKDPLYKNGINWHVWHSAGILKYGESKSWSTGYNCNPRELNIETDLGSWTVTLNEV